MKKAAHALAAAAFAISAIAAAPATTVTEAQQDDERFAHHVELPLDRTQVTVEGGLPGGINANYFDIAPGTLPGGCSHEATNYCEEIEVTIDTTGLHRVDDQGTADPADDVTKDLQIIGSIRLASTQPVADFDLDVYYLNDDGTDGAQIGQSGNTPVADTDADGYDENVPLNIKVLGADEGEFKIVVKVIYFAAPSTYTVDMEAFGL